MYLKSIEVYGFKSFANKIIFEFKDGITGIVGPNGSGKSNVADAVRWVLGEQSAKQLRGTRMEDVIFSGTENRKAIGAAYVAITFDNSDKKLPMDYEEVTVARRVYRSGESEYILNGSKCRRKDVVDLFMDTGIGKEGYSIIGQGQIEKILSGRPEDRRELFDEAAGIVKYKKNKEATESALESERKNLERVTDILNELEKQLEPLSKQSEKAGEYLRLRDQLQSEEAKYFVLWNDQLKHSIEKVDWKLKIVTRDLADKNNEYDQTRKEYDILEEEIYGLEKSVAEMTEEIHGYVLSVEKAEGQIQVLEEQLRTVKVNEEHQKSNEQRLLTLIRNREEERNNLLLEREGLHEEKETSERKKQEEEALLEQIQAKIRSLSEKIRAQQEKKQNLLGESEGRKVSLGRYEVMEEQLLFRKSQITQKTVDAAGQKERFSDDLSGNQEDAEALRIKLSESEKEIREIGQKLSENQEKGQEWTRIYNETNERFQAGRSKLETLRNMAERYDGYGNSIRRVMEQKAHNPGVYGVVADIIKVKKEYETAVETALGGSIQNIVTDREETAKQMIGFLKQNRYGRATFLPLNAMKPSYFKQTEVLKETGVIGLASDLVETEPVYRDLVSHLLGRIIVADHIDHAILLARKYGYRFRIVTLEGESLNPGGAMTGGAFRNTGNLLGRQREMEKLKEEIRTYRETILKTREDLLKNQEERKELKDLETEKKESYQKLLLMERELSMEEGRIKDQILEQERTIRTLLREKQDIDVQIGHIKKEKEEIRSKQEKLVQVEEEHKKQEEELRHTLSASQEQENERQNSLMQINMSYTALIQKIRFFEENRERLEREIADAKQSLTDEQRNFYDMQNERTALFGQIDQLRKEIILYNDQKKQTESDQAEQIRKKENSLKKNKGFFQKREALSEEISGLDKEEYRLNGQKAKIDQEIEELNQYMWEHYELTLSKAKQYLKDGDESPKEIKHRIDEIKREMNKLGPINVQAIEEYREVSERYEFLGGQCRDIQLAEQKLVDIIKDLDEAMKKQFAEKFDLINKMFHKVFQELFGGGTGSLKLMEEDHILESGILITAQPPGKKLQNMMQLSGGEKALTAIALLFAIQNLKPSPFCLLDEIEAALDDSNVIRFASYLKKLTKDTQFIVITHRRGTMTAADMLYGITMQEKGVSTLISVDLIEKDLKA